MGKEQHYFVVLNLSQDVTLRLKIIGWIVTFDEKMYFFSLAFTLFWEKWKPNSWAGIIL